MSDSHYDQIAPVPPVSNAAPVQPVRDQRSAALPGNNTQVPADRPAAAVTTGGMLPPAYAQFVVNQDTHDVVIRIRDANTDRIIEEYPSPQVEELAKYMKAYVDTARQRAAKPPSN